MPESLPTMPELPNVKDGSKNGEPIPEDPSHQNSTSSGQPLSGSKRLWRQPKSVRDFANQASVVCTMLLNGKLDLEVARAYSGIARVVAQAISSEVSKSRFLGQKLDTALSGDVFSEAGREEGPSN